MTALLQAGVVARCLFPAFVSPVLATLAAQPPSTEPLPDPLTLEQALGFADEFHPDLELAQAKIDLARADLLQAESLLGVRAYVDVTPQRVKPSVTSPGENSVDDSLARLTISKRLYDFGRSRALQSAAMAAIRGRELAYVDVHQRRIVEIMARFLGVILADMRYRVDDEAMTRAFVTFDRARERQEFGQTSELELLDFENRFRELLVRRAESQVEQTSARARLAAVLNRPDDLPGNLVPPQLPSLHRQIPDYQSLLTEVLSANPVLLAFRKDVEAASARVAAERARRRPVLEGELEATEFERERASRDDWRAVLNLRVPLYQGRLNMAAIATAKARLREARARVNKTQQELRETVLDLVQALETFKLRREVARQRLDFRDLALERSRGLYDLGMRSDLGDSMKDLTEAQWLSAQADYGFALTWAKLDALRGKLVDPVNEAPAK